MHEWAPQLKTLLGSHAGAETEIFQLTRMQRALRMDHASPTIRARTLDIAASYDRASLMFLMPAIMARIADPSKSVQERVVALVTDEFGDSHGPLVSTLGALVGKGRVEPLRRAFDMVERTTLNAASLDGSTPFASLAEQRDAILALSVMGGLYQWCVERRTSENLLETYREFLMGEDRSAFRQKLEQWLTIGPMYVRFIAVQLVVETGVSLRAETRASDELRERYERDASPHVAGAALEGYARRVAPADVVLAAEYLYDECATFRARPTAWRSEGGTPRDDLRVAHVSIRRALGLLVARHLGDRRPAERLLEVVSAPPSGYLDLLASELSVESRRRVLYAAATLDSSDVRVRLRLHGQDADVGLAGRVRCDHPRAVIRLAEADATYWARPDTHGLEDPEQWTYHLVEVAGAETVGRDSLLGIASSVIPATSAAGGRVTLNQAKSREIGKDVDARGWSMTGACDALATVCEAAFGAWESRSATVEGLIEHLVALGVGAAAVASDGGVLRGELRAAVKSIFLTRLANPLLFEWMMPADQSPRGDRLKLMAFLAESVASRSMREQHGRAWVTGNVGRLLNGALDSDSAMRDAVLAMLSVRFYAPAQSCVLLEIERFDRSRLKRQPVSASLAVWLWSDAELETAWRKANAAMVDFDPITALCADVSGPGAQAGSLLPVAAEVVARSLEAKLAVEHLDRAVSLCAHTLRPEGVYASKRRIEIARVALRRLLEGFAAAGEWRPGQLGALFGRLIRTVETPHLEFFLAARAETEHAKAFDAVLCAELIRALRAPDAQRAASDRADDSIAITNRAARPRLIRRELDRVAKLHPADLYELFAKLRDGLPRQPETLGTGVFEGRILGAPLIISDAGSDGVLVVTDGGLGGEHRDLPRDATTYAANIATAFVRYAPRSAQVSGLLRFDPRPAGVIDYLSRAGEVEEDWADLKRLVGARPRVVVGRVEGEADSGGGYSVRLGVKTRADARWPGERIVLADRHAVGDRVLVEIRAPRTYHIRDLDTQGLANANSPEPAYDLRPGGAIRRLAQLARRPGGVDLLLRGRVVEVEQPVETVVGLRVDVGVQIGGAYPRVLVAIAEAPAIGEEVTVRCRPHVEDVPARHQRTDYLDAREYRDSHGSEPREVMATLHSTRSKKGTRQWTAQFSGSAPGSIEIIDVPRQHLTSDLATLYCLDASSDDGEALERLATTPIRVLLKPNEGYASVVEATPAWNREDLLIALMTNRVSQLSFVKVSDGVLVFELLPGEGPAPQGTPPPFGVQVSLHGGELFSTKGESFTLGAIQEAVKKMTGPTPLFGYAEFGVKLTIVAALATVDREGTFDFKAGPTSSEAEPKIRVVGAPLLENVEIRSLYARDAVVPIRATPGGGIALENALISGLKVEAAPGANFEDLALGSPIDAIVVRGLDPFADARSISVKQLQRLRLVLSTRLDAMADQLSALVTARPGARCDDIRRVRLKGTRLEALAGGLKYSLDSALPYLIPDFDSTLIEKSVVVLTDARDTGKRNAVVEAVLPPELHLIPGGLTGVVTSIPVDRQRGGTTTKEYEIGVRWLIPDGEGGETVASMEWSFASSVLFDLGSVVNASPAANGTSLEVRQREFRGSVFSQPMSLDEVFRKRESAIRAVLLQRPSRGIGTDVWVFSLPGAKVLEIPREDLDLSALPARGDELWNLDLVQLVRTPPVGASPYLARVASVEESALRGAIHERVRLVEIRSVGRPQRHEGVLIGEGPLEGCPSVLIRILPRQLPPSVRHGRCGNEARWLIESVDCTRLNAIQDGDALSEIRDFQLEITFGDTPDEGHRLVQRPTLIDAIADDPAIETHGVVVRQERQLAVNLSSLRHDEPIPLPEHQQSWIAFGGARLRVRPDLETNFIIARDGKGFTASLRRRGPYSLESWHGHRRHLRLSYYGVVTDAERDLFHPPLEPSAPEEGHSPLVLFEIEPGETVIARADQIHFFGEPFDPNALQTGDLVVESRLVRRREGTTLEVDRVEVGVLRHFVWFKQSGGVFSARVAGAPDSPSIVSVRAPGFVEEPLDAESTQLRFSLAPMNEKQRQAVASAMVADMEVHLHAESIDRRGVIVFRVLDADEAYGRGRLVFVRAGKVNYNRELVVAPLGISGAEHSIIPESLYSERTRVIDEQEDEGRVLLVTRYISRKDRQNTFAFSLKHVPPRDFRILLRREVPHTVTMKMPSSAKANDKATARGARSDGLAVELQPGVNLYIPRKYVDGLDGEWRKPMPGDVLFLCPDQHRFRLRLTGGIRSHRRYITATGNPYITRVSKSAKGIFTSVAGLPQLPLVVCDKLLPEHEPESRSFAQRVFAPPEERWIHSVDAPAAELGAGKLTMSDDDVPLFQLGEATPVSLSWDAVTVRTGTPTELAAFVRAWQWRNFRARVQPEPPDMIETSPVIPHRDKSGAVSFVACAATPFPVDHLVEQFTLDSGRIDFATPRWFAVAGVHKEGIIVEVAPARYVALNAALILGRYDSKPVPHRRLAIERLARGDVIRLSVVPPEEEARPRALVAYFRLEGVRAAAGDRQPSDGERAPDVQVEFTDRDPPGSRLEQAIEVFGRIGRRLTLRGRVTHQIVIPSGTRSFVDVGLLLPPERERTFAIPSFDAPADAPAVQIGARRSVRVVDLGAQNGVITRFSWEVLADVDRAGAAGLPAAGDAVYVTVVEQDGDLRECASGFDGFEIRWMTVEDVHDSLRLDIPWRRAAILGQLSNHRAGMWATVEGNDPHSRILSLSRRAQIAAVLPAPGSALPASIIGVIGRGEVLIDLLNVPFALNASNWCSGKVSDVELEKLLDEPHVSRDVDVMTDLEGGLDARVAYPLPTAREFYPAVVAVGARGLLAGMPGHYIYVPTVELVRADVDRSLVEALFPRGRRIALRRPSDAGRPFSHVNASELRRNREALLDTPDLAITVRCEHVDSRAGVAIVSGQSGLVMELELGVITPPSVGERVPAFLLRSEAERLVLSVSEPPSPFWSIPALTEAEASDIYLPHHGDAAIRQLSASLRDAEPSALADWLRADPSFQPTPRNLRLVIERVRSSGDAVRLIEGVAAHPELSAHPLTSVLSLTGDIEDLESPAHAFAAGYWALLHGNATGAVALLRAAASDPGLGIDFDVDFTLARALHQHGDEVNAQATVARLGRRLFANGLATMTLPVPQPATLDSDAPEWREWSSAVEGGDLDRVAGLVTRLHADRDDTPAGIYARIWARIMAARRDTSLLDSTLSQMADEFLAVVDSERIWGTRTEAHWHVVASTLCFARGMTAAAWWHLARISADRPSEELGVAQFWTQWIERRETAASGTGTFLHRFARLWAGAERNGTLAAFDDAWTSFRTSSHRWILPNPSCRIVPFPPQTPAALRAWGEQYDSASVASQLTEDLDLADDSVRASIVEVQR